MPSFCTCFFLFIPSLNVFNSYFNISHNLVAAVFVWILINVVTQLLEKNVALLWFLIFCLISVETDRPALFAKSSKTSPPLPSSPLHPKRTNYVWDNKNEELTKEFLLNGRCFLFGCLRQRPNKFLVASCQKNTKWRTYNQEGVAPALRVLSLQGLWNGGNNFGDNSVLVDFSLLACWKSRFISVKREASAV